MILWITGNTGAGKTTLARKLAGKNTIVLDGDELRSVWPGLGFGEDDRWLNNQRTARLAKLIENQGYAVIVAMICPYKDLRTEVRGLCGCKFIYLPGGKRGEEWPYEIPDDAEINMQGVHETTFVKTKNVKSSV